MNTECLRWLLALLVTTFITTIQVMAQPLPPQVRWQAGFGGDSADVLYSAIPTADGGFLLGGESLSGTNGNKTAPARGGRDVWVIRLDSSGAKLWERSFGGALDDGLFSMLQTTNGDFVLGGYSESGNTGNKTSPNRGGRDFWVIRLDANGNAIWDQTYGGSDDDNLQDIVETGDGGFICGGYSYSGISGNKTSSNFGDSDFWIVRLDSSGNRIWDRSYGGTGPDTCYKLTRAGSGFVAAGSSGSDTNGNKVSSHFGGLDLWVVRLDVIGNVLWQQTYGGSDDEGSDDSGVRFAAAHDGGFIIGANSFSGISGNKTKSGFGFDDFWVVRLDDNGVPLWQAVAGGSGNDYLTGLLETSDGSFLLAGGSNSETNSTKTSPRQGSFDFWIVALNSAGSNVWDRCYGGTNSDGFQNVSIAPASGGFILAGDSSSGMTGNKTVANNGGTDYWIVRLDSGSGPKLRAVHQTSIAQNGFRLFLQGQTGRYYRTEFTANWTNWIPVSTNQITSGEAEILDLGASANLWRAYRALEWPP